VGKLRFGHAGPVSDDDRWVVLHCYAAYEELVIDKIKRRVPAAEVRRIERFPGYLAWRWDPAVWEDVRNAGGVTGYVGAPGAPTLHRLDDIT
jgi:transcription antitermination factor NusG